METEIMATVLIIYGIILAIMLIGGLTNLILRGIGLAKIGKRQGHESTWLAFLPYTRGYFQGLVAGEISLFGKKIKNMGVFILVFNIVSGIIITITFSVSMYLAYARNSLGFMAIVYVVYFMFMLVYMTVYGLKAIMNYQVYKLFVTTNTAIFHAVLSLFVPLYEPICLFALRNKPFLEEKPQEGVDYQNTMWL